MGFRVGWIAEGEQLAGGGKDEKNIVLYCLP